MKIFLVLLCCYVSFAVKEVKAGLPFVSVPEYYWRDFSGLIPTDALEGGRDYSNNVTYIGQFSITAAYNVGRAAIHTIPATISKGSKVAVGPYYGKATNSTDGSNLKIFCVRDTRRYRWASITQGYPPGCQAVIGGNEDSIPLFIGRVNQDGELVVGKIFSDPGTTHTPNLIVVKGGIDVSYPNYEILTYCCS